MKIRTFLGWVLAVCFAIVMLRLVTAPLNGSDGASIVDHCDIVRQCLEKDQCLK